MGGMSVYGLLWKKKNNYMYRMNLRITNIIFLLVVSYASYGQLGKIPAGFKKIFNGRDLTGWHISRTTHQGTTPDAHVKSGVLYMQQHPYGQGGVLLSNKKYG